MARAQIYTVHIDPSLSDPYGSAEFIQEGFSWKAFFFPLLWALYHRLWLASAVLIAYNIALLSLVDSGGISRTSFSIVNLGVHILIGFEATEWRRAKLQKRGYLIADLTSGDSPLRAELRFFDRYFAGRPAVS